MSDELDIQRRDALGRRVNGVAGGLKILWSTRDVSRLAEYVASAPANLFLRDLPAPARELANAAAQLGQFGQAETQRRKFSAEQGIAVRATQSGDLNFLFKITSETVDLMGDVVSAAGVDCSGFNANPCVLNSHDSSQLPVAISTAPKLSEKALTAIAKFPAPGISETSDQIAAALRSGLLKGCSIGFAPLTWKFSKDSARPFGIDFLEVRLLEYSTCAIPANPSCLLIGAVGSKSSRSSRNAEADDAADDEDSDWQCDASDSLPLDESDDAFNAAAAKSDLIKASSSPDGTILDSAASYFLAVDASAPMAATSYQFPFCRVTDAGIVAAKTGWRESLTAMEKSNIKDLPVNDARALVDRYEARLGDIKMAARRREAAAIAVKAKTIIASAADDPPPLTKEERMAEARAFKRRAMDISDR